MLNNVDGQEDVKSRLYIGEGMSEMKSKVEAEMTTIKKCSKE